VICRSTRSQSRLWENHVGRSRAFWELFLPDLPRALPETDDATVEDAYQAFNQVHEDNLIRVEADELTYHLHIVVRFGSNATWSAATAIEDVPEAWNDKYEEYLRIRPDNDAEGCLGHPLEPRQLRLLPHLLARLRDGRPVVRGRRIGDRRPPTTRSPRASSTTFGRGGSVRTSISTAPATRRTPVVKRATGEDFSADAFTDYVEEKYGELYGI